MALERLARTSRETVAGALTAPEEARLVASARAGDAAAMRRLLTVLSGAAYRYGRSFCRNADDAEDVMQDVLASLARSLSRFRGDGSLTSWAYVVARRACIRHRRRRSGEPADLATLDAAGADGHAAATLADPAADPVERVHRAQLRSLIERAILDLPAPQRVVLLLRDVEGLSARAVGKALGLGERAVKSRLHRARVALRVALAPHLDLERPPAAAAASRERSARTPAGCPDTALMISRYLEGELTPARCDELASHVARCGDCLSACETLRVALGACRAWGRGPLPAALRARVREAIRRAV